MKKGETFFYFSLAVILIYKMAYAVGKAIGHLTR